MDRTDELDKLLVQHFREAVANEEVIPAPAPGPNRGWVTKAAAAAVLLTVPALFLSSLNIGNLSAELFTGLYEKNETTTAIIAGLRRANQFVSRVAQEESNE